MSKDANAFAAGATSAATLQHKQVLAQKSPHHSQRVCQAESSKSVAAISDVHSRDPIQICCRA